MRKLREIVRLKPAQGLSGRTITKSCGISPSTASEYAGRIALAKLSWPLPPELDDDAALERLLFPAEAAPATSRSHTAAAPLRAGGWFIFPRFLGFADSGAPPLDGLG
jgi:hypothetical protein